MTKPVVLELVRMNKPAPSYEIDNLIRRHGHEIRRLPPYYPQRNAIELIWSQLNAIVRSRNLSCLMTPCKLTVPAFADIGADRWRSASEHVEETIVSMQTADNAADVLQRNLVVDLGADTDSETGTAREAE